MTLLRKLEIGCGIATALVGITTGALIFNWDLQAIGDWKENSLWLKKS